ncbi:hypothetical protein CC1G_15066 [Coprinopsis cinerea okayama7|uniref:Uncharacterized protein n=1 Tax=Coprinopsis cinerea (strain Okayama-7 / 130 / ATCC MYA-4618 / FGSC 9003) TaxID=240176 RepID=D6RP80_COPC7|nr:hypothetical protein CC1G_15066 [Coprinopsis cinerea okayama7\|eukprot:XP_002910732.1 hypothetical protein CC1G_15066 [Coprinopsis cinerea okayama7\
MPSLPDNLQDIYQEYFDGLTASQDTITHLRRELMQAVWDLILSEEDFMKAYTDGIVLECADGIQRRFFPRIFTYSADYPEKVLLATIRQLGSFPCPRCLIKKEDIGAMGTHIDRQCRAHVRIDDEHAPGRN